MKIFPYSAFAIQSKLSLDEAEKLFGTRIEPRKFWRSRGGGSRFQGTLQGDAFTMSRIIGYQNSFLPMIKGRLESSPSGARIHVTMSLPAFTAAFMCVWFGVLFLFFGIVCACLIFGNAMPGEILLGLIGMAIFGIALVSGGFWFEAVKQKPMLLEIFQGEIIANPPGQPNSVRPGAGR